MYVPVLSITTNQISSFVSVIFDFFANPSEENLMTLKKNTQVLEKMTFEVDKLKNWAWQNADVAYAQKEFAKTEELKKLSETTYQSMKVLVEKDISVPIATFLNQFEAFLKNLQGYFAILENDLKKEQIQREIHNMTRSKINIA